jgi:hypothetical protein
MKAIENQARKAIKFALEAEDGMQWLKYWNDGEFAICRHQWPEAPESCYIDADQSIPVPESFREAADANWQFFELVNNYLIERGLLKIVREGGADAAAYNVIASIAALEGRAQHTEENKNESV